MDVIWDITAAWESVTSTDIQNCFPICGFGIEDAVDTTEEDHDNSDQVELQGKIDCPSNTIIMDKFIQTTDDLLEENLDHGLLTKLSEQCQYWAP